MAIHTSARYFVIYFLLIINCEESEEKCIVMGKVNSYCDSLQDLYLSNVTLLKRVHISKTGDLEEFKVVPVERAKFIESLEIKESISKIPENAFENFANIKYLGFVFNKVETIEPGIFKSLNLTTLSFYQSGIKKISKNAFFNLPKLKELRCTHNNLTDITRDIFNNLTARTLALSVNQISKIETSSFADMPNLERLFLDDNLLTEFNVHEYVTDASKLERFWLHRNKLTQVTSYMLEGLSNVKVLNLGFNSISNIESKSFAETPKLRTLVLTHNFLKVVDGSVLPSGGLRELEILYLDHNLLMYLSSNFLFRLNSLKAMSIGGNPWQCPCLDLVLRWLSDNNVRLNCDKEYFSGNKPVCVVPSSNVCVYSYDEKLIDLFKNGRGRYPAPSLCLL